jgi:hypothetical protein
VKYCSDRCKKHKPSTNIPGSLDRRIEDALTALLLGQSPPPPLLTSNNDGNDATSPPQAATPPTPAPVQVKPKHKPKKGDPRIIVQLSELETAVFGDRTDPEKVYGRRKNRRARFVREVGEWRSVDMVSSSSSPSDDDGGEDDRDDERASDDDKNDAVGDLTDSSIDGRDYNGGVSLKSNPHVRPAQSHTDINFAAGGGERGWAEKISETPEMLARRREGQKRAEEKEIVKNAARRAVAFGLDVEIESAGDAGFKKGKGRKGKGGSGDDDDDEKEGKGRVRRKCEALMNGQVVEPSFAKGDWSIRWRED